MSTTYSVVCDDCMVRFELGQTSQGGPLRVYSSELWRELLNEHIGHRLRIVNDLVDDDVIDYWSGAS